METLEDEKKEQSENKKPQAPNEFIQVEPNERNDWTYEVFGVPVDAPGTLKAVKVLNIIGGFFTMLLLPLIMVYFFVDFSFSSLISAKTIAQILGLWLIFTVLCIIIAIFQWVAGTKITSYSPFAKGTLLIISVFNIVFGWALLYPLFTGIFTIVVLIFGGREHLFNYKNRHLKKKLTKWHKKVKKTHTHSPEYPYVLQEYQAKVYDYLMKKYTGGEGRHEV